MAFPFELVVTPFDGMARRRFLALSPKLQAYITPMFPLWKHLEKIARKNMMFEMLVPTCPISGVIDKDHGGATVFADTMSQTAEEDQRFVDGVFSMVPGGTLWIGPSHNHTCSCGAHIDASVFNVGMFVMMAVCAHVRGVYVAMESPPGSPLWTMIDDMKDPCLIMFNVSWFSCLCLIRHD